MNELIVTGNGKMTSREIAELAEKEHFNVIRDIKKLIETGAINALSFELVDFTDAKGEKRPMYSLDFRATMTLITGYDARRRALVINRWIDLENGKATPSYLQHQAVKPRTMTQKYREAASIVSASMSIGKLLGTSPPMAKAIAVETARRETGLDFNKMLPSSELVEAPVGIRALAKMAGIKEKEFAALLEKNGIAAKDEHGGRILTEKAKKIGAGSMEPYQSATSSHTGYMVKFFPSKVLPLIKEATA